MNPKRTMTGPKAQGFDLMVHSQVEKELANLGVSVRFRAPEIGFDGGVNLGCFKV